MKQVVIVGAGLGLSTLSLEALETIREAEVLLGSERLLAEIKGSPTEYLSTAGIDEKVYVSLYEAKAISEYLGTSTATKFAILVSGDPGFYSAAVQLLQSLKGHSLKVLPGMSSMNCFFARLQKTWEQAALISCHGRKHHLVDTVRRNKLTFALSGGNVPELAESLCEAGFAELKIWLGENLGSSQESISELTASELKSRKSASLSVLLIENSNADARIPSGLPDEAFLRGDVPMTKSEVRAISLAKLNLKPDAICCDIGAGTGSVTVEMALAAYSGEVYAIEKEADALELIKANCRRFHLGNVHILPGDAAELVSQLPPCDAAFIGGSGGALKEIIRTLFSQNPRIKIVVNAITLETMETAVDELKSAFGVVDLSLIQVSRLRPTARTHMLQGLNPIFIISAGGEDNG